MLRIPSQAIKSLPVIRSQSNPVVKSVLAVHKSQNNSQSSELLIQSPYLLFSLHELGYRYEHVFLNMEHIEGLIRTVDDRVQMKEKFTLPEELSSELGNKNKNTKDSQMSSKSPVSSKQQATRKSLSSSKSFKRENEKNPSPMNREQAHQWLIDILEMLDKKTPIFICSMPVLEKMTNLPSSSGYLATMKKPHFSFERLLANHKIRKIVVCDRVVDPGNMGTIIRNAVAYGYDAIITTPDSVHVYNDKVIRSSAGAVFKIAIVESIPMQNIIDSYVRKVNGYTAYVATSDKFERVWDITNDGDRFIADFEKRQLRHILWLSNETEGISNELNQLIPRGAGKRKSPFYNRIVEVNVDTKMESINVSVASGIVMHKLREYMSIAKKKLDILAKDNSDKATVNTKVDFFEIDTKPRKKLSPPKSSPKSANKKLAGRIAAPKTKPRYRLTVSKNNNTTTKKDEASISQSSRSNIQRKVKRRREEP